MGNYRRGNACRKGSGGVKIVIYKPAQISICATASVRETLSATMEGVLERVAVRLGESAVLSASPPER